jgi:hypothetical protein
MTISLSQSRRAENEMRKVTKAGRLLGMDMVLAVGEGVVVLAGVAVALRPRSTGTPTRPPRTCCRRKEAMGSKRFRRDFIGLDTATDVSHEPLLTPRPVHIWLARIANTS